MKTFRFFQAALVLGAAAVFATSCNKDEQANGVTDEGTKSVILKINLGQSATKAAMEAADSWQKLDGVNVNDIAIYFTDNNDVIRYAYKATKDDSDGNGAIIWNNLVSGVRFIGMKGVSKVYAIANGPEIVKFTDGAYTSTGSDKVDVLNIDFEKYGATVALDQETSVPYVGADVTLDKADGTIASDDNAVIIDETAEGGPYVIADVAIRPVLSRFEVNEVSILTSGTLYFAEDAETGALNRVETEGEAKYKFDYSGFDAVLTGVYMTNFYRDAKLIPALNAKSSLDSWSIFETPVSSPITNGNLNGLGAEYQDAARYSNHNGTEYEQLITGYESTSGTTKYLFNGTADSKVIPFHFLFPYAITEAGDVAESPVEATATPQLHFQFIPGEAENIQITNAQFKNDEGSWENVTDDATVSMLEGEVFWPHTVGQTAQSEVYANVVSFVDDSGTPITITTGKIYRVQNVLVTPDALATSTKSTDASNVIVTVSIISFAEENVYPVFE